MRSRQKRGGEVPVNMRPDNKHEQVGIASLKSALQSEGSGSRSRLTTQQRKSLTRERHMKRKLKYQLAALKARSLAPKPSSRSVSASF